MTREEQNEKIVMSLRIQLFEKAKKGKWNWYYHFNFNN